MLKHIAFALALCTSAVFGEKTEFTVAPDKAYGWPGKLPARYLV